MNTPGYWMFETSGRLRPAIVAYLKGEALTDEDIAVIRAYLRQWIMADGWYAGPEIDELRLKVDSLTSRPAIKRWLDIALEENIDPL